MGKNILTINNLTKKFNNSLVLDNISLNLDKGDVYGILGPNGAGKTTLLKCILGLLKFNEGHICINSFNIVSERIEAIKGISGIVEYPVFYDNLSGYDNLLMISILNNVPKKKIDSVIGEFDLSKYIYKKVKTYSLGMKQRLGIARAFLTDPSIVVLDEPTNGLDPSSINEIRELIKDLSKIGNVSFVISSHNLSEVEQVCNKISILSKGKIINKIDTDKISMVRNEEIKIFSQNPNIILEVLGNKEWVKKTICTDTDCIIVTIEEGYYYELHKTLFLNDIKFDYIQPYKQTLEEHYLKTIKGAI